jgi:hypothetical protein
MNPILIRVTSLLAIASLTGLGNLSIVKSTQAQSPLNQCFNLVMPRLRNSINRPSEDSIVKILELTAQLCSKEIPVVTVSRCLSSAIPIFRQVLPTNVKEESQVGVLKASVTFCMNAKSFQN